VRLWSSNVIIGLFSVSIILASCGGNQSPNEVKSPAQVVNDSIETIDSDTSELDLNGDWQFADYWMVVADTSTNYWQLRKRMVELSDLLQVEIDTLGRCFDSTTNRVIVPYDSEDEIYAGVYYPRRYSGEFLSIEHLALMLETTEYSNENMALIVAIFDNSAEAQQYHQKVKQFSATSFVQYASLYVGCMH
jgi:hypothetical protein